MNKSIAKIREEFAGAEESGWADLYERYSSDERAGVKILIEKYRKKEEALEKERIRLAQMRTYEEQYGECKFICGIDEAGRGPLAGPVVAAAVILPKDCEILYLNDSKKLTPAKREALFDEIMEKAVSVGVGMGSPARIDQINILQATYEAMREAVSKLEVTPDLLLNDAVTIPELMIPQVPIIKGDAKSVSIAAASIVAKVTRDRLMVQYDEILPEYGFAQHKGYGSREHIEALKRLGPSPIHRSTFIKNFSNHMVNKRETGAFYERRAAEYLKKLGYEIAELNYRCRTGEIDIVAKDGNYMVFCEVKYRKDGQKGSPLEAVDTRKQQMIFRCAMHYVTERHLTGVPCRFDVIGIEGTEVTYIKDAFSG